jgi:Family of unknown function (DUF6331)
MKFDPPMSLLVKRCETLCVAACCGIEAYDFSPIHIASFVIGSSGAPEEQQVAALRDQLRDIHDIAHTLIARGASEAVDDLNHNFTGAELLDWHKSISANLDIALELIAVTEARRVDAVGAKHERNEG